MKTKMTRNLTSLALALAFIPAASAAWADGSALKEHICRGKIAAVDAKERTLKLHSWLGVFASWKFHLADDGTVAVALSKDATLNDLKPGMEVAVAYKSADGVRVASSVRQRSHDYSGVVQNVTSTNREVTIANGRITRKFWVPENARVAIHERSAGLDDLKSGQRVDIHFVWQGDIPVAYVMEDTTASFTGTVEAIDAGNGTVSVKHLLSEKKFNLGDRCRIVTADSSAGRLSDVRIGQTVTVHYHDMGGVLVASWLAMDKGLAGTATGDRHVTAK